MQTHQHLSFKKGDIQGQHGLHNQFQASQGFTPETQSRKKGGGGTSLNY